MTFWQDLRDHFETILIVAGVITFVVKVYQFCTPTRILMANHHRIVAVAHWSSHGSWLGLLQAGIRWVLGLMGSLYGPPRDGIGSDFRQNLTVRAWKMSALIATLILFAAAVNIVPGVGQILFLLAIFSAIPLVLYWRTILRDDEFSNHAGIERLGDAAEAIILEGTKLAAVIAAPTSMVVLKVAFGLSFTGDFWTLVICQLIGFLAMFAWLLRSIRRHGFLAPLAFFCAMLVLLVYVINFTLFFWTSIVMKWEGDATALWLAPAWISVCYCFCVAIYDRHLARSEKLTIAFAFLVIYTTGAVLLIDKFTGGTSLSDLLRFLGVLVLGFLGPYTLAVYAAIYSNAIPDWFSVALTRSLLLRASQTTRLADFLHFLFYDLMFAVALCLLTATILILAFSVSGIMVTIALLLLLSGNDLPYFTGPFLLDGSARFFFGGMTGLIKLGDALFGQPNWDISGHEWGGILTVVLLAVMSLTSLLPTLLNALAMLALIAARLAALVLSPPMRVLHGLLILPEDITPEDRAKAITLSSVILATLVTAGIVLIFGLRWTIKSMLSVN